MIPGARDMFRTHTTRHKALLRAINDHADSVHTEAPYWAFQRLSTGLSWRSMRSLCFRVLHSV